MQFSLVRLEFLRESDARAVMQFGKLRDLFRGVIPKPRAFTSGARDLACTLTRPRGAPREILHCA